MKHGIVIRSRETKEIIDFIECSPNRALKVLSGLRRQMDNVRFTASEESLE